MPTTRPKPIVLIILDGWGIAEDSKGNAITQAPTPFYDSLWENYPHTQLAASGEAVGLPEGEDGNTETGHLNLGAGRVVLQDLLRINKSIEDGSFAQNPQFLKTIQHVQTHQSNLHLMGLIGSGGVHSSLQHLYALLDLLSLHEPIPVYLHLFSDGRDSPPTQGKQILMQIEEKLHQLRVGCIATLMGRYYAMDRDNRWERTEIAYRALTKAEGDKESDLVAAIEARYAKGITDEFIKPIVVVNEAGEPRATVRDNDAVIFFNFRIDRPRQLTKAFVYPNFEYVANKQLSFDPYAIKYYKSHIAKPEDQAGSRPFNRGTLLKNLYFVTMTEYEYGLPCNIAYPPENVEMPLGRVVADMGLRQLRLSETEKERFVTFYFNGQREDPYPGEDRIIIPSPPVATYDLKPEMSSRELTQTLLERIESNNYDLIIINYANPDMVAHTGNLEASIESAKVTDENLSKIIPVILAHEGICLITADHGNLEELLTAEGEIDTEHSVNPVPLIVVGKQTQSYQLKNVPAKLGDVAPTILTLMNLPIPKSMTGTSLL